MYLQLILFGADGCEKCAEQKEILSTYFPEYSYDFVSLESTVIEDLEKIALYSIDDIPTLVIVSNDGDNKKIFRHKGIIAPNKLNNFIEGLKK